MQMVITDAVAEDAEAKPRERQAARRQAGRPTQSAGHDDVKADADQPTLQCSGRRCQSRRTEADVADSPSRSRRASKPGRRQAPQRSRRKHGSVDAPRSRSPCSREMPKQEAGGPQGEPQEPSRTGEARTGQRAREPAPSRKRKTEHHRNPRSSRSPPTFRKPILASFETVARRQGEACRSERADLGLHQPQGQAPLRAADFHSAVHRAGDVQGRESAVRYPRLHRL